MDLMEIAWFRWLIYAFAGYTILCLPSQIAQWLEVRRLYGGLPWSLIRQMIGYVGKTQWKSYQLKVVPLLFFMILLGEVREAINGEPYPRTIALIMTAWYLARMSNYVLPPSILFLGTSRPNDVNLMIRLKTELPRYRVVAFLEPREHIPTHEFPDFFGNNMRTRNSYEWRVVVHHLMDVVPVIVMDPTIETEAVAEETKRIRKRRLPYKTLFVADTDEVPEKSGTGGLDPQDGVLTVAVEQLPQAIVDRLRKPQDVASRRRCQDEITAMNAAVPRRFRHDASINGMLIKGHYITASAHSRFLRDCKGITPREVDGRLLEDIPSAVSREEERRYLQEDRGLEEVETIAISALELAKHTPGPNQEFNIANSYNKLGKLARFRQEWESAVTHLREAVERFQNLVATCRSGARPVATLRELADAQFLLGEVHMARYRENGAEADRASAERWFQLSIALDKQLAQDSAETTRRLQSLATGVEGRTDR